MAIFESLFPGGSAQLADWQRILRYTQLPGLAVAAGMLPLVHAMPRSFAAIGSVITIAAGLAIEIGLFSWLVWLLIVVFTSRRKEHSRL